MNYKAKALADSFAHFIKKGPIYIYTRIPSMRQQLLRFNVRDKVVQDLGTGTGTFARMAKSLGARYVLGTDNSSAMLQLAAEWPSTPREKVDQYALCSASDVLEGNLARFDIITAAYCFVSARDVQELSAMARSIYAQLKPDGHAIVYNNADLPLFTSLSYDQCLKYGVGMRVAEDHSEKGYILMQMNFYGEKKCEQAVTYTVSTYFFKHITEQAFAMAGFRNMEWVPSIVSEEGMQKFGREYWNDYLLPESKETVLIATK